MNKITAWSYSRLHTYLTCPEQAKFKYIDKLPEPPSPHMERGKSIHAAAEGWVLGKVPDLPESLEKMKDRFRRLLRTPGTKHTEQQWAFRRDWSSCGWFDKGAHCRMVMDLVHDKGPIIHIIDYKTGNVREENKQQLSLYAVGIFLRFPEAKTVVAKLWYLDWDVEVKMTFKRSRLPKLLQYWEELAQPMLEDRMFEPQKGRGCYWCAFKGPKGPCSLEDVLAMDSE